jgi:hypothetical protein
MMPSMDDENHSRRLTPPPRVQGQLSPHDPVSLPPETAKDLSLLLPPNKELPGLAARFALALMREVPGLELDGRGLLLSMPPAGEHKGYGVNIGFINPTKDQVAKLRRLVRQLGEGYSIEPPEMPVRNYATLPASDKNYDMLTLDLTTFFQKPKRFEEMVTTMETRHGRRELGKAALLAMASTAVGVEGALRIAARISPSPNLPVIMPKTSQADTNASQYTIGALEVAACVAGDYIAARKTVEALYEAPLVVTIKNGRIKEFYHNVRRQLDIIREPDKGSDRTP